MILKKFLPSKSRYLLLFFAVLVVCLVPLAYLRTRTPQEAEAAWYDDAWLYRKKITIDHTKVSGSNSLQNFPVLISLTSDSQLSAKAQADGDDIVFTDVNGQRLDYEIESYTSGTLTAWVKIPTLSPATDTILYLYYGNAAITAQENPNSVWSSNYTGVWHLSETAANNATITDSTNYAHHGRFIDSDGDSLSAATKIGAGFDLAGDSDGVCVKPTSTMSSMLHPIKISTGLCGSITT
jgi:hypothetical protein